MKSDDLDQQLYQLHVELRKWQNYAREIGSSTIIIFEGRDAAGKSSAAKRITDHLNPRAYRLIALERPTTEQQRQWYWQRYIEQFPRAGEVCFFDRSWYNRALVEPVMGFCTPEQTNTFFRECPQLEKMWTRAGIQIIKFWFSITKEEQQKRFDIRATDPLKLGKLSPVDLSSQSKWSEYTKAKNRMFALTNLTAAPWVIVDSNDKPRARREVMRYILHKNDYPMRDLTAIGNIDTTIIKVKK